MYHGVRKSLKLLNPYQNLEINVLLSGTMTLIPILIIPRFRVLWPYTLVMIGFDLFNEQME